MRRPRTDVRSAAVPHGAAARDRRLRVAAEEGKQAVLLGRVAGDADFWAADASPVQLPRAEAGGLGHLGDRRPAGVLEHSPDGLGSGVLRSRRPEPFASVFLEDAKPAPLVFGGPDLVAEEPLGPGAEHVVQGHPPVAQLAGSKSRTLPARPARNRTPTASVPCGTAYDHAYVSGPQTRITPMLMHSTSTQPSGTIVAAPATVRSPTGHEVRGQVRGHRRRDVQHGVSLEVATDGGADHDVRQPTRSARMVTGG